MNLDDQNVQVRLSEGTLDVRIRKLYGNVEVDAANLAFTPTRPGEYRIDTNPDTGQSYVTVRDGEGQVTGNGGSFTVHMGQQAVVAGQDQSAQYQVYNAPGYDAFDRWVMSRNGREDRYAYQHYVSPEMVGYEDLGQYGSWRHSGDYGDVWVPSSVSSGWAPYQDGHWAWVEPWGWTWVDNEPWGFAPFHYGRWAFVDGAWGWCPGPVAAAPIYAPALVAWVGFGGGLGVSVSLGGGPAVGWFPLGPRDVYIPAYAASAAYVTQVNVTNTTIINRVNITNVYTTYTRTGAVPVTSYMNRTVPGALMAVPQNDLAAARPVRQVAIRLQPNQITAVRAVDPAPRVAPQVASVLGRSAPATVPHPPAAVLSHPVIARTAPPVPPPSFQARQSLLAQNPGRPVPVAQLHQLASAAPVRAVRPPVRVLAQARPVTPVVAQGPAPRNLATAPSARTAPPEARQPTVQRTRPTPVRPFEPPVARQRVAQPPRPTPAPVTTPRTPQPTARPYEPPATQRHLTHTPPPHPAAAARAPQNPTPHPAYPSAPPPKHTQVEHSAPPHVAAPAPHAAPPHTGPPPHAAPPPHTGPPPHAAPPERKPEKQAR
jgi:hypothetical protein